MTFNSGWFRTAVLAVTVVAAGCTAVVYEDGPRPLPPGPPPGPGPICTREYAPVCGERRGIQRTFSNDCEADASGYRVIYGGECRVGPPPRPRPPYPGPGPISGPGDRFCTQQYAPVCARRGRDVRTFGNACEAETSGYRVIDRGRC